MVVNCVAFGCKNVYSKDPNIQFHTFPFKRSEIIELWIKAIRRENWKPARTSRLCSKHFKESDYQDRPGSSVKLLNPTAVPSVFNFPKYLLKKSLKPRRTLSYNKDDSMKECASTSTAKEDKPDQHMGLVPLRQKGVLIDLEPKIEPTFDHDELYIVDNQLVDGIKEEYFDYKIESENMDFNEDKKVEKMIYHSDCKLQNQLNINIEEDIVKVEDMCEDQTEVTLKYLKTEELIVKEEEDDDTSKKVFSLDHKKGS